MEVDKNEGDDLVNTLGLTPTLLGAVAGTKSSDLEVLTKVGHIWDCCDTEGDFAYCGPPCGPGGPC